MSLGNTATMKRIDDFRDAVGGSLRFDTSRLRRNIRKHVSRTKEKVMHNLDKGEKTEDEFIRRAETILIKKQASTAKLQTELKRHVKAVKNVSASTRSLHETMLEAYEDTWAGRKEFADALYSLDSCWSSYVTSLLTVLEQVGNHVDEFVDIKDKVEKRKRKLVDYNLAKRNLHLVSTAKKKDESKLKKAGRDVEYVEVAYFQLNSELKKDLPAFYNGHVHFCCENWSYLLENEKLMYESLCSTVHRFISSLDQLRVGYEQSEYHLSGVELSYSDISRSSLSLAAEPTYANGDLYESLDDCKPRRGSVDHHRFLLGERTPRYIQRHTSNANHFSKQRSDFSSIRSQSVDDITNVDVDDGDGYATFKYSSHDVDDLPPSEHTSLQHTGSSKKDTRPLSFQDIGDDHVYAEVDRTKKTRRTGDVNRNLSVKKEPKDLPNDGASSASSSFASRQPSRQPSIGRQSTNSGSPRPEKPPRPSSHLPMKNRNKNVGKTMIAVHAYTSQDEDELDLQIDDLVQVLPWENENLKEDGWLFGMKLPDSRKGLFPENHTKLFSSSAY